MTFAEAARPIRLNGTADLAILFIHGFTSTPGSVAAWAEGLHKALGATVAVPLLPGHGTQWQDLNRATWQSWEQTVLSAFDELASTHRRVAVAGLSLGGALACLVAARRPKTAALILVNHLMFFGDIRVSLAPLIRRLVAGVPAIAGDIQKPGVEEPAYLTTPTGGVDECRKLVKAVKPLVASITAPTLIFKSRNDHVVPLKSATWTLQTLGSAQKSLVWLEESFHVATLDNDLPGLIEQSADFLRKLGG